MSYIPFSDIVGKTIAVEEKCDGANTGISFDSDGTILLQSRGHYPTGGAREKHYNLFKQWAQIHQGVLRDILGSRYIMYGEWLYAKHTIFYDALPHYFLEFDIYDRELEVFLDTPSRWNLLAGAPIVSVPVLKRSVFKKVDEIAAFVGHSLYITDDHIDRLKVICEQNRIDVDSTLSGTDSSTTMEGVYLKVEEDGKVIRLKFVRQSFLQNILESETHWLQRPIIPNQLVCPLDALFEASLPDGVETYKGIS